MKCLSQSPTSYLNLMLINPGDRAGKPEVVLEGSALMTTLLHQGGHLGMQLFGQQLQLNTLPWTESGTDTFIESHFSVKSIKSL